MITINVDSKGIDRMIFKLEKRVESYTDAVNDTMEYGRDLILSRVEGGNMANGQFRISKAKKKFGRYSFDYGKYDRAKKGLPTAKVTLKYTGNMFKNFLITRATKINVRNRLYKRSLYFSSNFAVRSNGTMSNITYNELAQIHDEKFGSSNYNMSMAQAKKTLTFFKQRIQRL
jgi:hypothetical protein